jgi:branched-chain amino acid transport system permease protein
MTRAAAIATGIVAAGLLSVPLLGDSYLTTHATRILVYAIFAMSLDLLVGYCGMVSLGHAAFFGVAAYTAALFSTKLHISNILLGLPVSVLTAAFAALLIGLLTLRTAGIYFIMATLAFAQMLYFLANDSEYFGGSDGVLVQHRFDLSLGNLLSLDVSDPTIRFYVVLLAAVLTFVGLFMLVGSPFGRVLQGIKSNERRMRALGYPVSGYKLRCFVLGGALAGLAGYLYVLLTSLADPSILDWLHSAQVLMMVLIGGLGTLVGSVLGAFLLIELIDQAAEFTEHWKLVVGIFIVAVTLFGKGGIVGLLNKIKAGVSKERKPS